MNIKNISVIGAGSWGTTLALLLADKKYNICLWEKFEDYYYVLKEKRENIKFLPTKKFPSNLIVTNSIKESLEYSDLIILAVPSHVLRGLLLEIKPYVNDKKIFVSVIKGIEQKTLYRVSEVVFDVLGDNPFVCLSGPTHAEEVANKIPSAITASSKNMKYAELVQNVFAQEYLRVYTNNDLIGVELGGSLKNVIAISAGISDGLGFGDNTKAALITRGLAEIMRLGKICGADEKTFFGLAGMGDLITTCASPHSRNRAVGLRLAKGASIDQIVSSMNMVSEGVNNAKSAYELALKMKVDTPIISQMYKVLFENKDSKTAVKELLSREYKAE